MKWKSWINISSSILAGWNIFLILILLLIILSSVVISGFGSSIKYGSKEFYIEAAISGLVAIFASYYLGKKIYMLLKKLNDTYRYVVLASLILVTVFLFPSRLNFNL